MRTRSYLICLLFFYFATTDAIFFKFEDCSKGDGVTEDIELNISPDPVQLDQYASVNMTGRILKDIPPEAVLKVQHYKLKKILGITLHIPIPCLMGKYGSCTLPLCEYLNMFQEQVQPFFPHDRAYGCPVKAGEYGGQNVQIKNPDVSTMARVLFSGKYETELTLLDKNDGKQIACFRVFTELK